MTWQTTTALYSFQQRAVDKLLPSRVGGLFMDMGTGKTRTVIEFACLRQSKIARVVWFCPVSLKETARYEILKHTDCQPCDILVFDDHTGQKDLPERFWNIVGLESMSSSDRVTLAAASLIDENTFVIVDESSYIKGHHATRTQRITRLSEKARYRVILTGTPISQGVVDLYAQMRFLSPKILGYNSFYSFARNHLEYHPDYPGLIVASHNTDWLAAKIQPYTYQVTKAECLDLPEKLYDSLYFGMSEQQAELYWRAKEEILLNVPDELIDSSYVIFRLFGALQQITCGFWHRYVYDERMRRLLYHEVLEVPHRRLDMLSHGVGRTPEGEPVIIWAKFQHSISAIVERRSAEHGAQNVAQLHGNLKEKERTQEIARFRAGARFLVSTQATGGHGLTLNEAAHHIFYCNGFKYSERIQAEDRSHRIGQTRPVTYTDIVCRGSIDERTQKALSDKEDAVVAFRKTVQTVKDMQRKDVREYLREVL